MSEFSRRSLSLGAAVAALGLIALFALSANRGPHADGEGPLGSLGHRGHSMTAVDPAASPATAAWTFGVRLCLATGATSATLKVIGPDKTEGAGYEFAGAGIRAFLPTPSNNGIISVDGYPPPASMVPDRLEPVTGYVVTTPCSNRPNDPYTELLIGFNKVGTDGGGWRGILVTYDSANGPMTLRVDQDLLICGPAVSDCTPPTESP